MARTNAFLNGFLGGMQAVNSMIDSQARRERYKVQKERADQKWQWQQQQHAQQQELQARKQQLYNTKSWAYRVSQMDPAQKKHFYEEVAPKVIREQFGNAFDNANDNETAEFSHFKVQGDQLIPIMRVKDKDGKVIRTGPATRNRTNKKGDPVMGISIDHLFNALATDPSLRNLSASANAETLRLGGNLPAAAKQGDTLGSKLFSSWTTTNKKGDELEHQLYKEGDQYVQLSFNKKTGQMKEANVAVSKVQALASQFGGNGLHEDTPEVHKPTVDPKNKTPVVADKPGVVADKPGVVNSPPPADNIYEHYKNLGNIYAPKIGRGIRDAYKQYQASVPARKVSKDRMQQAWSEFRPGFNLTAPPPTTAPPATAAPPATTQPQPQLTDLDGIEQKARQISATGDEAGLRDYLGQQDPKAVRKITQKYLRGLN